MQLEKKIFKMEFKEGDDGDGPDFSGVASVMGNKDLHDDIIDEGAFTRTLKHKNGRVLLLDSHFQDKRVGIGHVEEKAPKLALDGFLNLEKELARDTLSDMKFGHKHKLPLGLSIGFETIKQDFIDGVRHIKEVALWEVSVVSFPANVKARVTSTKAAIAFQDLPLAAKDTPWNAPVARANVDEWAQNGESKNAFVWLGERPIQIADIVDGKLMAVPRAIIVASALVRQGTDLPVDGVPMIREHLDRYYRKMGIVPVMDQDALDINSMLCYAASLKEAGIAFDDGDEALFKKALGMFSSLFSNGNGLDAARKHASIYDNADAERLSKEADQKAIDAHVSFLRNLKTEV